MRKVLLGLLLSAATFGSAQAQGLSQSQSTTANVPTGYQVPGATWYRLDRYDNHKVVQIPDLLDVNELRRAMQDPAHPKSMVKGEGSSGGGGDGGN